MYSVRSLNNKPAHTRDFSRVRLHNELNGLVTYDRIKLKVDAARMSRLSEEIYSMLND